MHVDLDVAVGVLDALDNVVGRLRLEQGRHVLERDGVGTHVEQLPRELHVALGVVHRRDRVADGALGVLAGLLDRSHRVRHVARIVHCVEDAEDVHAVLRGLVHEPVDDLVVVVAVAEQVLATKQHLQTGAREQLAEGPQAHPRVFVEESDTAVVSRSAPTFDRPVAGGVDVGARIDHVLKGHASGHQALMTVTQHQFGDTNFAGFGDLYLSRTHGVILSWSSGPVAIGDRLPRTVWRAWQWPGTILSRCGTSSPRQDGGIGNVRLDGVHLDTRPQ